MSTDKTEQALPELPKAAMRESYQGELHNWYTADQMRQYARAALTAAPPAQPQPQEPVAELLREAHGQIRHLIEDLTTAEDDGGLVRYVPKSTLMFSNLIGALHTLAPKMEAALAASPPRAVEPLTDEQIDALDTFELAWMAPRSHESVRAFARAIERAHNITAKP